jgi:hypothetical protein
MPSLPSEWAVAPPEFSEERNQPADSQLKASTVGDRASFQLIIDRAFGSFLRLSAGKPALSLLDDA